jgi:hypothetical protein
MFAFFSVMLRVILAVLQLALSVQVMLTGLRSLGVLTCQ